MERISIKNVQFSEALSEETNAFTADVYLDGKKFGYAKNNGQGGCTDVNRYPNKMEELKEAEAYAQSLGKIDFDGFQMDASLDALVDKLFGDHMEAKEIKKLTNKGIVYKDTKGAIQIIQWKISFKKVLAHPQAKTVVRNTILKIKDEGGVILNNNIPEEFMK